MHVPAGGHYIFTISKNFQGGLTIRPVSTDLLNSYEAGDKVNVTLAELMEERRKEFAAGGTRWHDPIRTGLITTIIPAWIETETVQHKIQPFTAQYIIYPVPKSQLDIAPGLYTQNQGYN